MTTKKECLQLTAQAWCKEKTKHKVMDPDLAVEFAEIMFTALKHKDVLLRKYGECTDKCQLVIEKRIVWGAAGKCTCGFSQVLEGLGDETS